MFDRDRRHLPGTPSAARTALDRRRWMFTEAGFLSVTAGVLLLFVAPPLRVHGVRRLGGGLFLGFGTWLDVTATREWKESVRSASAGGRLKLPSLPGRLGSGIAVGLGLGLLLLAFAQRR